MGTHGGVAEVLRTDRPPLSEDARAATGPAPDIPPTGRGPAAFVSQRRRHQKELRAVGRRFPRRRIRTYRCAEATSRSGASAPTRCNTAKRVRPAIPEPASRCRCLPELYRSSNLRGTYAAGWTESLARLERRRSRLCRSHDAARRCPRRRNGFPAGKNSWLRPPSIPRVRASPRGAHCRTAPSPRPMLSQPCRLRPKVGFSWRSSTAVQ